MDANPQETDSHPLSEKQTNTDDSKIETAIAALTDPKFPLPALNEKSSTLQVVRSFAVLSCLLIASVFGCWYLGVSMLQSTQPLITLTAVFGLLLLTLFMTGTVWIDWWELVLGYWWLSIPVGAFAGLVFILNQEASTGIAEAG